MGTDESLIKKDVWNTLVSKDDIKMPLVSGLKILLFGDSDEKLKILKKELKKHKAHVLTHAGTMGAYEKAVSFLPDAIISHFGDTVDSDWNLVRRLRQHPLLRWTPVLLFKWWKNEQNKLVLRLEKLSKLTAEILVPYQVTKDRIATGRISSDRIEVTGVPTLLRIILKSRLVGTLNVTDSFNSFEVKSQNGSVIFVKRTGSDKKVSMGATALTQLLMSDSGRWSFSEMKTEDCSRNFSKDFEKLLKEVSEQFFSMLDSPDKCDYWSEKRFYPRISTMITVASLMTSRHSLIVKSLVDAKSENAFRPENFANVQKNMDMRVVLTGLLKCGALSIVDSAVPKMSTTEIRVSRVISAIVNSLAKAPFSIAGDPPAAVCEAALSNVENKKADGISIPGGPAWSDPASEIVGSSFINEEGKENEVSHVPVITLKENYIVNNAKSKPGENEFQSGHEMWISGGIKQKQKLIAVTLALALTALMVAGIIFFAS